MRRPDGMDWASQLQLGLRTQPNLTGVRQSDCYAQVSNVAGIDGGLPIKVGNEAVQSAIAGAAGGEKQKVGANAGILGKRQGLQRPFERGVLGAFCRLCRK